MAKRHEQENHDAEHFDRLGIWLHAGPRPWEDWKQFERRIRLIGDAMSHALAARWLDDALHLAFVDYDHRRAGEQSVEWSDLEYEAGVVCDESYHRMMRAGAATFDLDKLPKYPGMQTRAPGHRGLDDFAEDGDADAVRHAAAVAEWQDPVGEAWRGIAEAYEAIGEDVAAEAFLARGLVIQYFGAPGVSRADGRTFGQQVGSTAAVESLRTRLAEAMKRTGHLT